MEKEEKVALAEQHSTSVTLINTLLKGGVQEDHLGDILDIKDSFYETEKKREIGVSSQFLIKLYEVANKDINLMNRLAEYATDLYSQGEISKNQALARTIRRYESIGNKLFE